MACVKPGSTHYHDSLAADPAPAFTIWVYYWVDNGSGRFIGQRMQRHSSVEVFVHIRLKPSSRNFRSKAPPCVP